MQEILLNTYNYFYTIFQSIFTKLVVAINNPDILEVISNNTTNTEPPECPSDQVGEA